MNQKKLLHHISLFALLICFGVAFVLWILTPFLTGINKQIQNSYYVFKNTVQSFSANSNIIIAEINDKSLEKIGNFPFSRQIYADVLENLSEYEVAVTAFDVLFLDSGDDPRADENFAKAIQKSRVVLGSAISQDAFLPPISLFQSAENGFLSPNIFKDNNTVYTFSPQEIFDGREKEHFALKIIRSFYSYIYNDPSYKNTSGEYTTHSYIFSKNKKFPLASANSQEILINFIPGNSFQKVSLSELLDPSSLKKVDEKFGLKDSIILIGPAADGLKDEFFTPNGVEYGVYIHANILNTLLSGNTMMYFQKYLEAILIFCIIVLTVFLNLSRKISVLILGNLGIIAIFWVIFPLGIILSTNLILNYPIQIILSFLFSLLGTSSLKILFENASKSLLNSALSEYVSGDIASAILSQNSKINLDGEKRNVICFFSDIENFTHLSEKLSPEELVAFLREYLSLMTDTIMGNGGYIDKYEGDAIMALWGVFDEISEKTYEKVCLSALQQQKILQEKSQYWKQIFGQEIHVRIGVHAGAAIIGNIGAKGQKMNFTALGDSINLASRLEGINKFYDTRVCVSSEIFLHVKDKFHFRKLDKIAVKGKDSAIEIYELREEKVQEVQGNFLQDELFQEALQQYFVGNFSEAKTQFESLMDTDTTAKIFYQRCDNLEKNPPESWDGVWRYTEK